MTPATRRAAAEVHGNRTVAENSANTAVAPQGAAKSDAPFVVNHPKSATSDLCGTERPAGATSPDLARVIAAWPRLPENIKAAIRAIVESHCE